MIVKTGKFEGPHNLGFSIWSRHSLILDDEIIPRIKRNDSAFKEDSDLTISSVQCKNIKTCTFFLDETRWNQFWSCLQWGISHYVRVKPYLSQFFGTSTVVWYIDAYHLIYKDEYWGRSLLRNSLILKRTLTFKVTNDEPNSWTVHEPQCYTVIFV